MKNEDLKIPKKLHTVTLWVHPEGRVVGSIFLSEKDPEFGGTENPRELLNRCKSFLVFKVENPDELRFYNIKSVIRVEYEASDADTDSNLKPMKCHLNMMDGSHIQGTILESLPPDQARLLDYLNQPEENFIKVHMDDGLIYLINKSYINHVHVTGIGDTEVGK